MFDPETENTDTAVTMGRKRLPPEERMLPQGDTETREMGSAPLDTPDMQVQHGRLMSYYTMELEKQAENRAETELDFEFYDNHQWAEEDEAILEDRGQKALVYNVVATTIDWVTGAEKRARTDFKVLARQKEGAEQAERKSDLLKYLNDVNRAGFAESDAFEACVKGGVGWLEEGVQDGSEGEPVYIRSESWRNMLHDSNATEKDLSDARYIFRSKWVDLDIAVAWFPKRKGFLMRAAQHSDRWGGWDYEYGDQAMDSMERDTLSAAIVGREFGYSRERVRIIEAWFRKPTLVNKMRGGQFAGEVFDPYSKGHIAEISAGRAVVVNKTELRMHCAVMTTNGLLYIGETPYRHNRFPFTPLWCYRRDKTGLPYGMIRRMRGVQQDINWRASKALHILSTNKTLAREGSIPDVDKWAEESARADALLIYKGEKPDINIDRQLAPAHLDFMSRSIQWIQSMSGVTDENLGRRTNATSGVAIEARQDQGSLATAGIFDSLHFSKQVSGEKRLSLIEQFFEEEKQFRITNRRGTPVYVTINSGLPEDDITATKADFVISEDEWRATLRQSQTEELVNLLKEIGPVAPQAVLVVLDLVVEGMDIANRDEIVRRIRQVSGMSDPDATEPTPEEIEKQAKQAKLEEQEDRLREAEIAEKENSGAQKGAAAGKLEAETQNMAVARALQGVQTQMEALTAAMAALTAPGAVPVADKILHEAGFKGRTEVEDDAEVEQKASALEQLAMEGAAQQQPAPDEMQQPPMEPGVPPNA
jgi:hypothetical protein